MASVSAFTVLTAGAVTLAPGAVSGADWEIVPRIEIRESYTDNVFLTSVDEEDDFITTVAPGISINRDGKRLDVQADYALNYLIFAQTGEEDTRHRASASLNAEVVRDLFYLDGRASVNQQFLDRAGPQSIGDANLTDNRATVQTYQVSPYFAGRVGQTLNWEARYSFNYFSSDRADTLSDPTISLSDGMGHRISASIGSGAGQSKLTWTLSGLVSRFDREGSARTSENDVVRLNLGYQIGRKLSLLGSVGYERTNLSTLSADTAGVIWDAGFTYRPGPRTTLTARYGRRIRDDVFSGQFTYRVSASSTFTVQYSDTYRTSQQSLFDLLNNAQVGGGTGFGLGDFVDNNGVPIDISSPGFNLDDRDFRSQRGSVGWNYTKNRTTINLSGFYELRDYNQTTAGKDKSNGASLSVSRRLSSRGTATLTGQYRNTTFLGKTRQDEYFTGIARYDYRLSRNLTAYVQAFHYNRQSDSAINQDIIENGATISIRATF